MRRELRANGGIMGAVQREKFGLGSSLKKFARKIIPNEIADIAVKAAPFVAPFNPALAGAMSGIGSFDQTGSISKGVKAGLINYGLGQGARYLGGKGFQGNPFEGDLFSSPMGDKTGIGKMLSDRAASKGVSLKQGMSQNPDSYLGIEEYLEANNPGILTKDQSLNLLKQKTDVVATSMNSTNPFMDSAKKLISGDFTEMGEGLKELGGQGLKAVFTKPHPTIKGETIFDKTAAFATIAGGATYLDAKRLAEEAELVVDGDEYTEDMYEADKAFYLEKYQKALPSESFYKKGGRVKYGNGSGDGIPSIMLEENEENDLDVEALNETLRKYPNSINEITDFEPGIFGPNEPTDQGPYPMDDKTQEEKEAEMLYELERELNGQKDGGRIGFAGGSEDFNSQVDMAKKIFQEYYVGRKEGDFKSPEVLSKVSKETGLSLENSKLARSMYENYIMNQNIEQRFKNQKYGEAGVPLLTLDSSGEIIDDGLYKGKKDGGRIGFKDGPKFKGKPLDYTGSGKDSPQKRSGIISINPMQDDLESLGGGIGGALSAFSRAEKSFLFKTLAKGGGADRTFTMPQLYRTLKNPGKFPKDEAALKAFLKIKGFKEGGRIGYNMGSPRPGMGSLFGSTTAEPTDLELSPDGIVMKGEPNFNRFDNYFLEKMSTLKDKPVLYTDGITYYPEYNTFLDSDANEVSGPSEGAITIEEKFMRDAASGSKYLEAAEGGRAELAMGSEVPVRNNQGGITELDYRNTGGFVPIGVKEKADDVPAMLSKNEFVFTADAVRAAGGGSMNKGAQKMYGLMKSLENKVV